MKLIKLQIKTINQKYPIIIGNGSINKLPKYLKDNSIKFNQFLIVIDEKVPNKMIKKILNTCKNLKLKYWEWGQKILNSIQRNILLHKLEGVI